MAAERIIGVDFGTSTSVVRVKRYQDGKPLGSSENRLDTQAVVFNMGSTMVPTVITHLKDAAYYGEDALVVNAKGAAAHQGFKVGLESPVELQKAEARALTEEFLSYLAKAYKEQSEGGHLGSSDDIERTIISYPVKWSEETKKFMIEAATNAGFPNVEGMDEAQAAIHAVTVQSEDYLMQRGYLRPGVPCNILLIDMGAGTTDLVLCRYTSGENPKKETLCTWPKRGDILFGGQEVERILRSYVRSLMEETQADQILSNCSDSKFKAWKEFVVSPALAKGDTVNSFGELDGIANLLGIDMAPYDLDRRKFEAWAKEYLKKFSQLIRGCIGEAGIDKNQIELVILTGGHSQWYFVKEILAGRLTVSETNDVLLPQISRDTGRIIQISRPQETVALGLVYSPISAEFRKKEKPRKAENAPDYKKSESKRSENNGSTQVDSSCKGGNRTQQTRKIDDEEQQNKTQEKSKKSQTDQTHREERRTTWNSRSDIVEYYRKNAESLIAISDGINAVATVCRDGKIMFENPKVGHQHTYKISKMFKEIREVPQAEWKDVIAIAKNPVGRHQAMIIGVRKDGTVVAAGDNQYHQCDVGEWTNIVSASCGDEHVVGVRKNGAAIAAGNNQKGQCNVAGWRNITHIVCGTGYTAGLREDGTVVATGGNLYHQCDVGNWKNIVQIACGHAHTVGLREDGTVVATGVNKDGRCNVENWKNIVRIACGDAHTVGLREDGTVVATGANKDGRCNVENWMDIVSVSCGANFTIGLKRDGHVEGTGRNEDGACNVSEWEHMIAIVAGDYCTVGIREDGSIFKTYYEANFYKITYVAPNGIMLPWKVF